MIKFTFTLKNALYIVATSYLHFNFLRYLTELQSTSLIAGYHKTLFVRTTSTFHILYEGKGEKAQITNSDLNQILL